MIDRKLFEAVRKISLDYFSNNPPHIEDAETSELHSSLFKTSDDLIVSGLGIREEDEGCIIRMYADKRKARTMKKPLLAGCPVEYVYLGEDTLLNSPLPNPYPPSITKGGKLPCGSSIGTQSNILRKTISGTLGAIVKSNENYYGLGNNHVLAGFNFFPKNKPFNMPSPGDLRASKDSKSVTVGRLDRIEPIRYGNVHFVEENKIDSALIALDDISMLSSLQGEHYDTPVEIKDPVQGMAVKKVGRSTDLTYGEVYAETPLRRITTGDKKVPYFYCGPMFEVVPTDDHIAFSMGGDSGSLVVTKDSNYAVGLLVSGSKSGISSFIIPIRTVLECFGVELVNKL